MLETPGPVPDGEYVGPNAWERLSPVPVQERVQVPVGERRLEPGQVQRRARVPARFELWAPGPAQH